MTSAILDSSSIRELEQLGRLPLRLPFLAPLLRVVRAQAIVEQTEHLRRFNLTAAARANRVAELAADLLSRVDGAK